MMTSEIKNTLRQINQKHTFSTFGLEMIDSLINRSTFVCFVHRGIIYDYDSYVKIAPNSFTVPFLSSMSRKISDFTVLESLARLIAADQFDNTFWGAIAFADSEVVNEEIKLLNTSLGIPSNELVFTQKFDAKFSLKNMAKQIISQPFVSFGMAKDVKSNILYACLDIQDGETFLFIA